MLLRDRLLVAANAALVSLTGNPDTHFGIVNEGVAPALVATLQHGKIKKRLKLEHSYHYRSMVLMILVKWQGNNLSMWLQALDALCYAALLTEVSRQSVSNCGH